jgi:acyl transferase domain-containing protein
MDYNKLTLRYGPRRMTAFNSTGASLSVAAGRLAFAFNFRGPALSIDTACSSSLVAAHSAASALGVHGAAQCGAALVAGCNVTLSPDTPAAFLQAGMLSPEGRCKALDAAADGYVRAEACGVMLLHALRGDAALPANNSVAMLQLAGSAVNQDGRSSALTAPNGPAQQDVMRAALSASGLTGLTSLQLHGTGTPLGDPIELGAVATVLGGGHVAIGASKVRWFEVVCVPADISRCDSYPTEKKQSLIAVHRLPMIARSPGMAMLNLLLAWWACVRQAAQLPAPQCRPSCTATR